MFFLGLILPIFRAFICLSGSVAAQDTPTFNPNESFVTWTYPDKQLTFNFNDTILISWASNYPSPNLIIWCPSPSLVGQYVDEGNFSVSTNGTFAYNYEANGEPLSDWSTPAVCHVDLDAKYGVAGAHGAGIIFTSTSGIGTTWLLGTSFVGDAGPAITTNPITSTRNNTANASSTTITSTSGSATLSATALSSTPQDAASNVSNGISMSTKIGIGVGAALFVILIVGATVWMWVTKRRLVARIQKLAAPPSYGPYNGELDGKGNKPNKIIYEVPGNRGVEVEGTAVRYELGSP